MEVQVDVDGQWQPLDQDAVYSVVTNNFVRSGGDGYSMFAEKAQNAYDYGPNVEDVVAEFLAENAPYTPSLHGRISQK